MRAPIYGFTLILVVWAVSAGAQDTEIRIGIVYPAEGESRDALAGIREGAARAAAEQNVELVTQTKGRDVPGRVKALLAAATDKPLDGLILVASSPDGLVSGLERAANSQIPVITLGSGGDISVPAGAMMHIGLDDFEAGRKTAERLRNIGADRAICVRPPDYGIAEELRCMGLSTGMDQDIEIQTLPDSGSNAGGAIESLKKRSENGYAVVFVAPNPLSSRLSEALKVGAAGTSPVVAFDPDPTFISHLAGGHAAFAVDTQPQLQGYLSVVVLANAARTGMVPASNIDTGPRFITVEQASVRLPQIPRDRPGTAETPQIKSPSGEDPNQPGTIVGDDKGDSLNSDDSDNQASGQPIISSAPESEAENAGQSTAPAIEQGEASTETETQQPSN